MTSLIAAVGRLLLAVIFVLSGIGKLSDPAGTAAYIDAAGLPMAVVVAWCTIALEILGGLLLIIGFQTRFVALALAAFCIAAGVLFHGDFGDRMQMIQFLKNLAMAGGLLQVVAFGAGSFSLDGRRAR